MKPKFHIGDEVIYFGKRAIVRAIGRGSYQIQYLNPEETIAYESELTPVDNVLEDDRGSMRTWQGQLPNSWKDF